jgi:hypothetical protein
MGELYRPGNRAATEKPGMASSVVRHLRGTVYLLPAQNDSIDSEMENA